MSIILILQRFDIQLIYTKYFSKHKIGPNIKDRDRGFKRSRQPVNFVAYFPNHRRLLSILDFVSRYCRYLTDPHYFSTKFDATMQEMAFPAL